MRRLRLIPAGAVLLLVCWNVQPAAAQERYNYTLSLLGGLGGSSDAEPDAGFGNGAFQVGLAMVTEPRTQLGARFGRLGLDRRDGFGSLSRARLEYANVAGEYRLRQAFYESGVYLGLGAYRLSGRDAGGASQSETSLGAVLGVTGQFEITHWLSTVVELAGHYAFLDEGRVFGAAHVGLGVHFR